MSETNNQGGGALFGCGTFLFLVALLFIAAKLFGFINWSWWLVLLPTFAAVTMPLVVLGIVLVMVLLLAIGGAIFNK